jgi:hypothetical protein
MIGHIIKFKSGNKDTVRIISHSRDGIYYHLISELKKTRFVMMAEVDTILTDCRFSVIRYVRMFNGYAFLTTAVNN